MTRAPGEEEGPVSPGLGLVVPADSLPSPDERHAVCAEMGLEVERAVTILAADFTGQWTRSSRQG